MLEPHVNSLKFYKYTCHRKNVSSSNPPSGRGLLCEVYMDTFQLSVMQQE